MKAAKQQGRGDDQLAARRAVFTGRRPFGVPHVVEDPLTNQSLELELPKGMELVEGKHIQAVGAPPEDASSSMVRPFNAPTLRQASGVTTQATFFTTVAAAQRFVQLRTQGKYRDLMSLVEFGDQAYVVDAGPGVVRHRNKPPDDHRPATRDIPYEA